MSTLIYFYIFLFKEDKSYYDEDSENEDYDEYKNDEVPNSYSSYKNHLQKYS